MSDEELFTRAIKLWGATAQMTMVLEETCELQLAILRLSRKRSDAFDVTEEMVDVDIMLRQLKIIMQEANPDFGRVYDGIYVEKMKRLGDRLDKAEAEQCDKA